MYNIYGTFFINWCLSDLFLLVLVYDFYTRSTVPMIVSHIKVNHLYMLCTAQLGGPVLEAFGRVQYSPFSAGW